VAQLAAILGEEETILIIITKKIGHTRTAVCLAAKSGKCTTNNYRRQTYISAEHNHTAIIYTYSKRYRISDGESRRTCRGYYY